MMHVYIIPSSTVYVPRTLLYVPTNALRHDSFYL